MEEKDKAQCKAGRYDDIRDLPHPFSARHPHMTAQQRAAQYSPFDALSGYGEAVRRTQEEACRQVEEGWEIWTADI